MDFPGKGLGVVLHGQGFGVTLVAQEEACMLGDALFEALIFGEVGLHRDPPAIDEFSRGDTDRAGRPFALDAEKILGRPDRVFSPTRFEDGLRNRHRCGHAGRGHRLACSTADEFDEFCVGQRFQIARLV